MIWTLKGIEKGANELKFTIKKKKKRQKKKRREFKMWVKCIKAWTMCKSVWMLNRIYVYRNTLRVTCVCVLINVHSHDIYSHRHTVSFEPRWFCPFFLLSCSFSFPPWCACVYDWRVIQAKRYRDEVNKERK